MHVPLPRFLNACYVPEFVACTTGNPADYLSFVDISCVRNNRSVVSFHNVGKQKGRMFCPFHMKIEESQF